MHDFVLFVGGSMFGAKSSRLILEAKTHEHMGRRVMGFKPEIDDRYSPTEICTHNGLVSFPSRTIATGEELSRIIAALELTDREVGETTIVVDEAFMIPGIAKELIWFFRHGFSILVASLDISSSLEPFAEIAEMLPWATRVEKCTAVCEICKGVAHFTWKKIPDEGAIQVGGADIYSARCFNCHPLLGVKA